jgi:hypothetical protein
LKRLFEILKLDSESMSLAMLLKHMGINKCKMGDLSGLEFLDRALAICDRVHSTRNNRWAYKILQSKSKIMYEQYVTGGLECLKICEESDFSRGHGSSVVKKYQEKNNLLLGESLVAGFRSKMNPDVLRNPSFKRDMCPHQKKKQYGKKNYRKSVCTKGKACPHAHQANEQRN